MSNLFGTVKSIGELQELIKDLDPKKPLVGTFESTFKTPSIYEAKDGSVVIDLDDCFYKDDIESGDMPVQHDI